MKLTFKTNGDELTSVELGNDGYVKLTNNVTSMYISVEALGISARWVAAQEELEELEAIFSIEKQERRPA